MSIQPTPANQVIVHRTQRAIHTTRTEARKAGIDGLPFSTLLGGLLRGEIDANARTEIMDCAFACVHSDHDFYSAACKANDLLGVLGRDEAADTLHAEKRWAEVEKKYA